MTMTMTRGRRRAGMAALALLLALGLAQGALAGPVIQFSTGTSGPALPGANSTGFTRTFSDGSATATFGDVFVDSGVRQFFLDRHFGLGLGSGGIGSQWTVSFDHTVTLLSMNIDFVISNHGFDITGPGVAASHLLAGKAAGVYALAPITFQAQQAYVFSVDNHCPLACGAVGFHSWEFAPVVEPAANEVPEPPALALALVALAASAWPRRQGAQSAASRIPVSTSRG